MFFCFLLIELFVLMLIDFFLVRFVNIIGVMRDGIFGLIVFRLILRSFCSGLMWFFFDMKDVNFLFFRLIVLILKWIKIFFLLLDCRLIVCFVGNIFRIFFWIGDMIIFLEGRIVKLLFIIFFEKIWLGILVIGWIFLVIGEMKIFLLILFCSGFVMIFLICWFIFFWVDVVGLGFGLCFVMMFCICVFKLLECGLKIVWMLLLIFSILDVLSCFRWFLLIFFWLFIVMCRWVI